VGGGGGHPTLGSDGPKIGRCMHVCMMMLDDAQREMTMMIYDNKQHIYTIPYKKKVHIFTSKSTDQVDFDRKYRSISVINKGHFLLIRLRM
jgi:hypothetical protein